MIHYCWNNALHCCETKHNGFQTFPCSDPRYKYWFMAEKVRAISTFLQNQPLLQDMAGNTATTLTLSQYLAWIIYMFGLSFYRIVLCSYVREKSIRKKGCRNRIWPWCCSEWWGRIVKWCTQSTLFCYQTFTLLRCGNFPDLIILPQVQGIQTKHKQRFYG